MFDWTLPYCSVSEQKARHIMKCSGYLTYFPLSFYTNRNAVMNLYIGYFHRSTRLSLIRFGKRHYFSAFLFLDRLSPSKYEPYSNLVANYEKFSNSKTQIRRSVLFKATPSCINNTKCHQTLAPRSKVVQSTKPDKNVFDNLCSENRLHADKIHSSCNDSGSINSLL
jgi:hypothetical protein